MRVLAVLTMTAPTKPRVDPARSRGLRRARKLDAALPELSITAMPAAIDAIHFLALMTRSRQALVDAGKLAPKFLCHRQAFTTAYAELGYYRRLAAGGECGGTIGTSMPQLVAGLHKLHPRWDMSGGSFAARDRHHAAVRKRLRELADMGVLRWRAGTDDEGEERRTEIYLLAAPAVSAEELEAAARQLVRWQARYGLALNSGSSTQVRNAAGHGRPLSASERQRRGVQHTKKAATARRLRTQLSATISKTAPPSGALRNVTEQQTPSQNTSVSDRTRVTRARVSGARHASAALNGDQQDKTAAIEKGVGPVQPSRSTESDSVSSPEPAAVGSSEPLFGSAEWEQALIARVAARQAERASLIAAVAGQVQARAVEVSGWTLGREWPRRLLAEAWVVARYGAHAAAESGTSSAGPLSDEDYARLRRAVARYERNAAGRLDGWPERGLAALMHLGVLAAGGELARGPRLVAVAIARLDAESRRMRARVSADSVRRVDGAAERAGRRRHPDPAPAAPGRVCFRSTTPGDRWPAWILLAGRSEPTFDKDGLVLDDELVAIYAPAANTDAYRMALRDAYLLAGVRLPYELDGRVEMAMREDGRLERRARAERPAVEELELRELAHRAGESISVLRGLSPSYRQAWLQRARRADADQARADAAALREQIRERYERGGER